MFRFFLYLVGGSKQFGKLSSFTQSSKHDINVQRTAGLTQMRANDADIWAIILLLKAGC